MAVPKRKKTSAKSAVKYSAFVKKEQKRITDLTKIVPCSNCKAPHLAHTVCPDCGYYAGRPTVVKKTKEVTTIKV